MLHAYIGTPSAQAGQHPFDQTIQDLRSDGANINFHSSSSERASQGAALVTAVFLTSAAHVFAAILARPLTNNQAGKKTLAT